MIIWGLEVSLFIPMFSPLVMFLCLIGLNFDFSISCLTDHWNKSRVLFGGFGLQVDLGLNFC